MLPAVYALLSLLQIAPQVSTNHSSTVPAAAPALDSIDRVTLPANRKEPLFDTPRLRAALIKSFEAIPTPITPSPADQQSFDALRAWFRRTWVPDIPWPPSWEAHIRDLVDVQPDGSTRYRQTDSVNALMFESLVAYQKDFRKVTVPALALWAPLFLPESKADTAAARKVAQWEKDYFAPFREKSIRRFNAEVVQAADTVLPNTSHASIGAVDVDGLVRIIRAFLEARAK